MYETEGEVERSTTKSSPLSWGPDVRLYRYRPSWMVGYAFARERLLAARGVSAR